MASVDEAPKLSVTFVPGFACSNAFASAVNDPVSDAAASTTIPPVTVATVVVGAAVVDGAVVAAAVVGAALLVTITGAVAAAVEAVVDALELPHAAMPRGAVTNERRRARRFIEPE